MNKKFLEEQMKKLETNYGRDKFVITKEIFGLWYEMFDKCDERLFRQAIIKCIQESEFTPTIATVTRFYKEIEKEDRELKETIKNHYVTIRSIWGEKPDKETLSEIVSYIKRFPKKQRKVEMIELTQRAVSFSHDCDACGRKDKPTIKEYLQGKR